MFDANHSEMNDASLMNRRSEQIYSCTMTNNKINATYSASSRPSTDLFHNYYMITTSTTNNIIYTTIQNNNNSNCE